LTTLASPQPDQPLILYISATHTAVSEAIVQEGEVSKEGKKLSQQVPIYFVSEALAGSKKYYSEMERICYAVIMSARRLHHYFEAHRVTVLTNQPLNDIFGNRNCSGRVGKWAIELSEHVIDFEKRSAIKSEVLAAILKSPSSIKLRYAVHLQFTVETDKCSNNIAEYETVLLGLQKLRAMGV
jgi:hypothetical protein